MRTRLLLLGIACGIVLLIGGLSVVAAEVPHPQPAPAAPPADLVPGELIVQFAPEYRPEHISRLSALSTSEQSALTVAYEQRSPEGYGLLKVPEDDVDEVMSHLKNLPGVANVERNAYRWSLSGGFPNDPYYSDQWSFPRVQADAAWRLTRGDDVIVAVVDTGVAFENYQGFRRAPDLEGTEFVTGWNSLDGSTHAYDEHGHGTHVTGTIAQTTHNGWAVAGIAHKAKIMPIKVADSSGTGSCYDVGLGIYQAINSGARVVNISMGGYSGCTTELNALREALARDVTVVASAGNDGVASLRYPAAYAEAVAVGASTEANTRADFSNYGTNLDLVAPGVSILQETFGFGGSPTDFGLWLASGTSMAAPHVSAAAAMLYSAHPTIKATEVITALTATARDLGTPGWDMQTGAGLLQINDALSYWGRIEGVDSVEQGRPTTFSIALPARQGYLLPVSYRWEVPGSSPTVHATRSSLLDSASLTFQSPGRIPVTLTVTDSAGRSDIFRRYVEVTSTTLPPGMVHRVYVPFVTRNTP